MNKLKNFISIIVIFLIIFILFKYNYLLNKTVIDGVSLWLNNVFPSLFIMFILNDIIINTNSLRYISLLLNNTFNKIFTTNGNAIEVFLLSLISGSPTNAYIIKEMLDNGKIDLNSANKLISYTYFSNPLFLYKILSITFNNYTSIKIIIIHYLSNLLIGLIIRNKKNNSICNIYEKNNKQIIELLPSAIKKSMDTLIMILGTIVFYMIIGNFLITILTPNSTYEVLIKGILEITQGLQLLNTINNDIIKEILAISIISFGGLSIHTQVYTLIKDSKIKYSNFLKGRLLQVLIVTILHLLWLGICTES